MKRMDDARKKMKRINKNQGYKKGSARGKKHLGLSKKTNFCVINFHYILKI